MTSAGVFIFLTPRNLCAFKVFGKKSLYFFNWIYRGVKAHFDFRREAATIEVIGLSPIPDAIGARLMRKIALQLSAYPVILFLLFCLFFVGGEQFPFFKGLKVVRPRYFLKCKIALVKMGFSGNYRGR